MTSPPRGYFDRAAARYLSKSERNPWKSVRSAEWLAIREQLALMPGQDVLDLGCGAGYYSLRIRAVENIRLYGVDASHAMINVYRAQGFEGACCRAEAFKTARTFDRVLIAGLLEFVEAPELIFKNLAGLLNVSGIVVCLIPKPGLSGKIYGFAHALQSCPTYVRDPARYVRLAESHGLGVAGASEASFLSSVVSFSRRGAA